MGYSSPIEFLSFSQSLPQVSLLKPDLFVTQKRLYLTSPEIGLHIFDIRNDNEIELVGSYIPTSTTVSQIYVNNDEIALVTSDNTFQIIDVQENSQITSLFSIP